MNHPDLGPPARLPFPVTRAAAQVIETRAAADGGMPTMSGHFSTFNDWYEVDSLIEGHFLERIAPGAFAKTIRKSNGDRGAMKVLYDHGQDPSIGNKVLGPIESLEEDAIGPAYEVPLLDTSYNRDLVPGLQANLYGSSFRFHVNDDQWNDRPTRSEYNPDAIPERTITETHVYEFGPVTFPANPNATAGARSTTDSYYRRTRDPEGFESLLRSAQVARAPQGVTASLEPPRSDTPQEPPHPDTPRTDPPPDAAPPVPRSIPVTDIQYVTRDDKVARVDEIQREMETLDKQFDGKLPEEPQARWDGFVAEKRQMLEAIDAIDARARELATAWRKRDAVEDGFTPPTVNVIKSRDLSSIYDVRRIEREARSEDHRTTALRDAAMRAVEGATFPTKERAAGQADIESLLNGVDYVDPTEAARRVLYTGSPSYRRAYRKYLTQGPGGANFTPEEANAFEESRTALVTASNVAVPFDLDSTMAINTSGAINPFRQAFRVVKTTSNDWRPLVSSGMTAVYEDEATVATDLSPAFTAPARLLVKAHTAATFSVEIQGDYPGLEAELSKEIADAKDVLEAVQFSTGAGSTHFPDGIFTYYTANFLDTTTTLVIVPADLYKLEANIGPRYRQNTVWLGSPYFYSLVRGIDTAGGAGLWVDNLSLPNFGSLENNGRLGTLLGHPAYECVAPANTSMATTEKVAILANRDRFVIIDRIGMNIELIPNFLDATTGYPTGQRMVYAWWRNTSVGIGLATLGSGRSSCIFRGK
jgi:HK97 family phage major capsid protein/HK97 family phage prohead protease